MKNIKWSLLFIVVFLIGCGSSSKTEETDVNGTTNVVPIATTQKVTVKEDTTNNPITLAGTDADADILTYAIVSQPKHGILKLSGKVVSYTPTSNYFGSDSFDFKVNDGKVNSASATVSITITDVAEPSTEPTPVPTPVPTPTPTPVPTPTPTPVPTPTPTPVPTPTPTPVPTPTPTPVPTPTPTPVPTPTPTPVPTPTPTPVPTPTPTPVPTPTPTPVPLEVNIILKSTEKMAGYEINLKFQDTMPIESTLILDNDFLASTGRTVSNLGPDMNTTTKELKFGAFSFGNEDGVAGEFTALSFEIMEGDISIIKQTCLDKNANTIDCEIQIQKN